jgi:hypothetical protein
MHDFCEGSFSWGNVVIVESRLACGGKLRQARNRWDGLLQGFCQVVANDFLVHMWTCAQRTPEGTNAAIVLLRGL